mgnify:CR=1 FL=1
MTKPFTKYDRAIYVVLKNEQPVGAFPLLSDARHEASKWDLVHHYDLHGKPITYRIVVCEAIREEPLAP